MCRIVLEAGNPELDSGTRLMIVLLPFTRKEV